MKILVTGGAGFIGGHLTSKLIDEGHKVVILDDLSNGKKERVPKGSSLYKVDIRNTEVIDDIFLEERPDLVIHAAAQSNVRISLENPLEDASINHVGTINVVGACKNAGIERIIYTSTGGARYGDVKHIPQGGLHEEVHPRPSSPYGISKLAGEHYVRNSGLDYLIFCFGNVYGPGESGENGRVIPLFIEKMLKGESPTIIGDGNQTRDFIYVTDLVDMLSQVSVRFDAGEKGHRLFNLSSGKQVSVKELYEKIAKVIGFEKEPQYFQKIKGEVNDNYLNCSKAKRELGWKPKVSLREGLKRTVNYLKNERV